VGLIVDEMSKNGVSYFNILLSSLATIHEKTQVGMYFWDSISMESQTAQSIATTIAGVVKDLGTYEIKANAYVSDNCPSMVKSLDELKKLTGRNMVRIPCACHALNLVFKSVMECDEVSPIWENVNSMRDINDRFLKSTR